MAGFMSQVMGGGVAFDPSQLLLTSGATAAVEVLCFCLADPGNAFLIPTPYYPGLVAPKLHLIFLIKKKRRHKKQFRYLGMR